MYKNYFLFEKQINELKQKISEKNIINVFTYRKNEAIFELEDNPPCFLMINIDVNYPYILYKPAEHIRLHKFNLFDCLKGQVINDISIQPYDKLVTLSLNEYTVNVIFYGSRPNIIITKLSGEYIDSFKERRQSINKAQNNLLDFRTVSIKELIDLARRESSQKLIFFLNKHFAAVNRLMQNEIIFRARLDENLESGSINDEKYETLWKAFQDIASEADHPENYIYRRDGKIYRISLFRLYHLEQMNNIDKEEYHSINEAWERFIIEKIENDKFERLFKRCYQALEKRRQYLIRSLENIRKIEDLKERKKTAELKGNLLLTFKNNIPAHKSEVELENIFSDELEKIKIKLNPNKNVVENANQYFNKYKNQDKHRLTIDIKKSTYQDQLDDIDQLISSLKQTARLLKLNKIHSKLIEMKLIQGTKSIKENKKALPYSFNRLILEKEWDVYIGKSGENNDLLTFGFANKRDIWLHAQGTPGSHVIIRVPRRGSFPPPKVVEQAARIAAANSRAQHSTTVPVIYTEVRFVHRARKSPPGTVSVRNEKVLFVNPLKLS